MSQLTLTTDKLGEAAKRADKLGNDYEARVLRDMAGNLRKWGDLSHRQRQYCFKLLHNNSEEALKEGEDYYEKLFADATLLVEAEAVCRYYTDGQYFRQRHVAKAFLRHLRHGKDNGIPLPSVAQFRKVFENKYAEKVRESARNPLRYSVGDLVMIRKGSYGDLEDPATPGCGRVFSGVLSRAYRLSDSHAQNGKPPIWELPCMVLDVNHRHINKALTYNKARGGCRWLKVLPLGHAQPIDVMERDLKKCQKKKVS